MSETKSVQVVAALIRREDGRILICQRPRQKARGLLWEFPGGKVEPGETEAQALIRECREELGILIQPGQAAARVEHAYPDLFVRLSLLEARILQGTPQRLEHEALCWAAPEELPGYDFCPADRPILERLAAAGHPAG